MNDQRRNVMKSVRLNKKELLQIVVENRSKHIVAYEESVVDYRSAALKIAKENLELVSTGELDKIARVRMVPTAPISHEKEYNRAIRMLELSIENEIEVEQDVFNQLVLDEWHWKHTFVTTSQMYKTLV
jgi:hypothetical protein